MGTRGLSDGSKRCCVDAAAVSWHLRPVRGLARPRLAGLVICTGPPADLACRQPRWTHCTRERRSAGWVHSLAPVNVVANPEPLERLRAAGAPTPRQPRPSSLVAAGLFAGIGGIELGLAEHGFCAERFCEIDPAASMVLGHRFPGRVVHDDVVTLQTLGGAELVAAGFPCQDLSQAGRTAGIDGDRSGLVSNVFRLLDSDHGQTRWLLLENVPFMLSLAKGRAMDYLTEQLSARGWRWAYRVVDARAFGLPQRRQRVVLLASRTEDPRPILFGEQESEPEWDIAGAEHLGFYWTEGLRGLGLAADAVPTLKGGSGLGIPSPPAVWDRTGRHDLALRIPDIRDAERLQGFPADWTVAAPARQRWKLVGNAVAVPLSTWVGGRLSTNDGWHAPTVERTRAGSWPKAAHGADGRAFLVDVSPWPRREPIVPIGEFLRYPTIPLSRRAAAGFLERTSRSTLRFPAGLLDAVREQIAGHDEIAAAA